MMKTVVFVHSAGAQGTGEGSSGLMAHISRNLGADFQVRCPAMPDPTSPSCSAWQARLAQELERIGEGTEVLLVGHSLGGSVILKHIAEGECRSRIAGVFLIAAPYWGADEEWQSEDYQLAEDFTDCLPPIPHIYLYHSREDSIVSFAHMQAYHRKLPHAQLRPLPGEEHYFSSGLAQLVDDMKRMR
ncbi:serine hydrolase family protein [Xylanibacillus composti]|uniref:Alpha/beta hydrolase n=1 Tax=Xylanibacillus composti TaxID=1572762 RepID=A0A8J4M416_9BACL|nr:alpha/beta fold hydrolase [Xylanibacillus composti]MDT9726416.1 serine hydrolase family protein [Xylanibacillus composti]GIQ71434.1 alpha/beta hydrolase [Xylanibacillus composti]